MEEREGGREGGRRIKSDNNVVYLAASRISTAHLYTEWRRTRSIP